MNELERLSRRRRIALMVMASAFLAWQVPAMDFFADAGPGTAIAAGGFLLWAAGLVLLLATGHSLRRAASASTEAALEDELVKANRARAFTIGYGVALAAAALCFGLSLYYPVSGTDAAHIVLVAAVVAPMYAFAFLERFNA